VKLPPAGRPDGPITGRYNSLSNFENLLSVTPPPETMSDTLFPCPSCGFLMFSEPPGTYEICDLCGWEDDPVQLAHPLMGGGANKFSLAEHQQRALELYPRGVSSIKGYTRAPNWRPLRESELQSRNAPVDGRSYFEAATEDTPQYYWLRDASPGRTSHS
jgi:hypothetical protein